MVPTTLTICLSCETETAQLATQLGSVLHPGDVVLLEGNIGAGKTHFARSLIQSLLTSPEDVPSPTFTLVQVYETQKGEIWHSDLYRLTSPDEAVELGLEEAFETAICLIEWPDRLADLTPENALKITLSMVSETARSARFDWTDPAWGEKLGWLRDGG